MERKVPLFGAVYFSILLFVWGIVLGLLIGPFATIHEGRIGTDISYVCNSDYSSCKCTNTKVNDSVYADCPIQFTNKK